MIRHRNQNHARNNINATHGNPDNVAGNIVGDTFGDVGQVINI